MKVKMKNILLDMINGLKEKGVKDGLQSIIQNIITLDNSVMLYLIITGNSIKATFDKDVLTEIYASLNNIN
ncbi:12027_t:CDS:2 [Funneliformis mosseae]|uniref:12027_t:CDS:1 n=1 Tax=Funneliformis mosseae TaxID=27381 RepID=A0A9N9CUQ6_FUNMO|nr:12027_t:CDS:2 [Funneliformis mosseae]